MTPSFTAAYQLTPDANVYLRYAEGYRSGGFNGRSSTPDQVGTAFEPETLDSYELGLKSLLWDQRLQVNVAAFLSDYKDLQQVLTAPTSTGVGFQTINDNVGKITITGSRGRNAARRHRQPRVLSQLCLSRYRHRRLHTVYARRRTGLPANEIDNERVIPLISKDTHLGGSRLPHVLDRPRRRCGLMSTPTIAAKSLGGGATLKVHPMEDDPSYIRATRWSMRAWRGKRSRSARASSRSRSGART